MDGHLYLALLLIVVFISGWFFLELRARRHVLGDAKSLRENNLIKESVCTENDDESHFLQQSFHITDEFLENEPSINIETTDQSNICTKNTDKLLTISVFAKPHNHFASYDLLQAISSTGMQFGDMNIFHYYQRNPQGKRISLFSLASATKPGEFDLDRMGSFSCVGLTFFMDISHLQNPLQAYYLMISIAEHLAEDLDGELRADPKTVWTEAHFKNYEKRIMQSQLTENV